MTVSRQHASERRPQVLMDHVRELRNRLMLVVVVLLLASSIAYVFRDQVIMAVLEPYAAAFGDKRLMYLNPAGGSSFIFLVTLYAAIAVTIPLVIQQIYSFIRPTLPTSKRTLTGGLLVSTVALLVAGVLFGYFLAVPGALHFLGTFAGDYVDAALTADSYLGFIVAYTLGLGVLFQIPLLLIIWHQISPLTPTGLLRSERWIILLTVIAAAIITPTPDPINLMVVAVPIVAIYQLGVVVVLLNIARGRKRQVLKARPSTAETTAPQHRRPVALAPTTTPPTSASSVAPPRPLRTRPIDGVVRHHPPTMARSQLTAGSSSASHRTLLHQTSKATFRAGAIDLVRHTNYNQ